MIGPASVIAMLALGKGAQKSDILLQFLTESVAVSLIGELFLEFIRPKKHQQWRLSML